MLVETVAGSFLSAVLVEHCSLGLLDEFVALLTLALLHHLTNLGMWVLDWL